MKSTSKPRPKVERWIAESDDPNAKEIIMRLRSHILKARPGINETIKNENLHYTKKGKDICSVTKNGDIRVHFYYGFQISDPENLLIKSGDTKYLDISSVNEIPAGNLAAWVQETVALHEPEQKEA